jgi:cell division protein FtsQ
MSTLAPGEPRALARLVPLGAQLDRVRRRRRSTRRRALRRRALRRRALRRELYDIESGGLEATGAHPRFIVSRASAIRRALRPRTIALWTAGTLTYVAIAAWAILTSSLFALDRVDVTGVSHASIDEVMAYADVPAGEPLLTADMARSERRIEAVPWVADARITRDWPQGWRIAVTERTPVVATPGPVEATWLLVDATGRVLAQTDQVPAAGVVPLTLDPAAGPPGSQLPAEQRNALVVATSLPPALAAKLLTASVDATGDITLTLAGEITVRFGTATDVRLKVLALATVLRDRELEPGSVVGLLAARSPTVDPPGDPAPAPTTEASTTEASADHT